MFFFRSLLTTSFWRYALFSSNAVAAIFTAIGTMYFFMEVMDFLNIYTKDKYSKFAIIPIVILAVCWVIMTRRPVSRVTYKVPKRDIKFEVKIGDIFAEPGDIIVSTSTTFDTDIASGLISPESLQGQVALRFFQGNTTLIDQQLDASLANISFTDNANAPGKKREYPIGTVAKVSTGNKTFYFLAMSRLNASGTAGTTLHDVENALEKLWVYVGDNGNLADLTIPLIGTGRGRIDTSRKKMTEKIAQSFADAAKNKLFSNKLTIMIHPGDADKFEVNLFEIKDYLTRSLHI